MSQTENNLKEAFAGESQANRKYTAFARKAEAEGYKGVAKLFKAAAAAEGSAGAAAAASAWRRARACVCTRAARCR